MSRIKILSDVVDWRLCIGCGACAYICPQGVIALRDVATEGIRPLITDPARCGSCRDCLDVCPGYALDRPPPAGGGAIAGLAPLFGAVLEIWEGHAADPEIRHAASSGGALTALGLYCIEQRHDHGVLHIGSDPADPVRNRTSLSRTRQDLLANSGSRYSPASAGDGFRRIEEAPAPCVFIGQPAEVAALRKAQRLRPALDRRVDAAFSFFCAGSPSTRGTTELLARLGIAPADLGGLRYRGGGWPGEFAPTLKGQAAPAARLSYQESWGALQKHRPFIVHLWPDDSGEAADISCGDPWYRSPQPGEAGSSLLVIRTQRGREIVREAMESGYLELTPAEPWKVLKAQENLVGKRRAIWGRRLAFRMFGLPVTRLRGFPLFRPWLGLAAGEKSRSFFGTIRRIIQRGYFRPLSRSPNSAWTPVAGAEAGGDETDF